MLQPLAAVVWDDALTGSPLMLLVPPLALIVSDELLIAPPIESESMNMETEMPVASKARSITYSAATAARRPRQKSAILALCEMPPENILETLIRFRI